MKAFLIDPKAQRITEVEYDGDYRSIYKSLDCVRFDVVEINAEKDCVFIDDEGLMSEDAYFFGVQGFPNPLAGKGLVLGTDDEGDSIEPTIGMEDLLDIVSFGVLMKMSDRIVFVNEPARVFKDMDGDV